MAKRITVDQLILAQKARFTAGMKTIHQGLGDVKQAARGDLAQLTSGEPRGKERIKWLRDNGHPYGRGTSAATSGPDKRKRGSLRRRVPNMPIGVITGSLRRRAISEMRDRTLVVGFKRGASNFVLLPGGTKKMVGRGLFAPGQTGGEVRKRTKARLYALRSHFRNALRIKS